MLEHFAVAGIHVDGFYGNYAHYRFKIDANGELGTAHTFTCLLRTSE